MGDPASVCHPLQTFLFHMPELTRATAIANSSQIVGQHVCCLNGTQIRLAPNT
jgi:hypothetical protein